MKLDPVIVLAAGASSRTPEPKWSLDFQGRSWLEIQLEKICRAGLEDVRIVTGYHKQKMFDLLPRLKKYVMGLEILENPDPSRGPFSSLQIGLQNIRRGAFVLPVDVPVPSAAVWKGLQVLEGKEGPWVAVPEYQGRAGHPVWLSSRMVQRLVRLPVTDPEARLDFQIRKLNATEIQRVVCEEQEIVLNLNCLEDFQKYLKTDF